MMRLPFRQRKLGTTRSSPEGEEIRPPVADPATRHSAGPRTWIGFGALCLGMFMAILDIQVVATSLPDIQASLHIPPTRMSWIQTAYLIAEVIAIPLTGWFTRVLTMRGLFVLSTAVFTLASLGCALSTSFAELVPYRIIQGFAAGTIIPTVFTAVFLLFPFRLQGLATTLAGVVAVLSPTLGPVVGGWITETYNWHWLFLINLAPGALVTGLAFRLLPAEKPDFAFALTLDWLGLMLLAAALATLEIVLKEAPGIGWQSAPIMALSAFCLLTAAGFIRRTWRAPHPVVDLTSFADRDFAVGCALSFVLGMGLYGSVYLMPVFLSYVRQHGALDIGLVMLVTGGTQLLIAPLAAALERRSDARLLTACGFALFAAGMGASYFATPTTDFDGMFWPQVVRGSAIMFCLLPPTRLALGHLSSDRLPGASGLFNLMRNLGGAIGIALIDTVIWGRVPAHIERLVARLMAGDAETARFVGLPLDRFHGQPIGPIDEPTRDIIQPLVEQAGLAAAIDEAWLMLAAASVAGLLFLPLARRRGRPTPPIV